MKQALNNNSFFRDMVHTLSTIKQHTGTKNG